MIFVFIPTALQKRAMASMNTSGGTAFSTAIGFGKRAKPDFLSPPPSLIRSFALARIMVMRLSETSALCAGLKLRPAAASVAALTESDKVAAAREDRQTAN